MSNGKLSGGFAIRITVLLLILAVVGYALFNDYANKGPSSDKIVKDVVDLINVETDDGHGIPADQIRNKVGFEPSDTFNLDQFKVEEFRFKRTIPFFKLRSLYVVYFDGSLYTVIDNRRPTLEELRKDQITFDDKGYDPNNLPRAAGGGPGMPPVTAGDGKSKDDTKDEDDDKAAESDKKSDDASDSENADKADNADNKSDDSKSEGENADDKKADDAKDGEKEDAKDGGTSAPPSGDAGGAEPPKEEDKSGEPGKGGGG